MPEFEQAFGCTGDGTMMRAQADRVKIW
jgi:hypothetical protein